MSKKKTVSIVEYSHKHGIDLTPCTTYEKAKEIAYSIVRSQIHEFTLDSLFYATKSDEYLLKNWDEITCGTEFISIHKDMEIEE
jgi:hypothetical protein